MLRNFYENLQSCNFHLLERLSTILTESFFNDIEININFQNKKSIFYKSFHKISKTNFKQEYLPNKINNYVTNFNFILFCFYIFVILFF